MILRKRIQLLDLLLRLSLVGEESCTELFLLFQLTVQFGGLFFELSCILLLDIIEAVLQVTHHPLVLQLNPSHHLSRLALLLLQRLLDASFEIVHETDIDFLQELFLLLQPKHLLTQNRGIATEAFVEFALLATVMVVVAVRLYGFVRRPYHDRCSIISAKMTIFCRLFADPTTWKQFKIADKLKSRAGLHPVCERAIADPHPPLNNFEALRIGKLVLIGNTAVLEDFVEDADPQYGLHRSPVHDLVVLVSAEASSEILGANVAAAPSIQLGVRFHEQSQLLTQNILLGFIDQTAC